METAKANGLNVNDYILYLLTELPGRFQTKFEIDEFLPWAEAIQQQFKLK
jgi:hypothetical protein